EIQSIDHLYEGTDPMYQCCSVDSDCPISDFPSSGFTVKISLSNCFFILSNWASAIMSSISSRANWNVDLAMFNKPSAFCMPVMTIGRRVVLAMGSRVEAAI